MENYEYIGDLGSGSYGFVWKCLQRSSGRIVAVKGFKLAHTDKKFLDQAIREVRMLRASCNHPNVVQLLEAFKSCTGRVYMVFEFVERCLSSELHKRFTCGLPAAKTRLVLWQLLCAVAHLHSKKIIHRDIKPGNLLMTLDGVVKLCDFGFARTTRGEPHQPDRFSSYVVTRWYRSPEMLVSDLYSAASDIWSLGCTFAEIATGRPLFPGTSSLDQLWRIMRCLGALPPSQAERFAAAATAAGLPEPPPPPPRGKSLWQRLPELENRLLDVVQACLKLDPTQRPTAKELMQMPYFWEIPKLIIGTPLEKVYSDHGMASARPRTTSLRVVKAEEPGTPAQSAAAAPSSRGVAITIMSTDELARGPSTNGVKESDSKGDGGAGTRRPPSVLLSAVAASLLGESPAPPGSFGSVQLMPLVATPAPGAQSTPTVPPGMDGVATTAEASATMAAAAAPARGGKARMQLSDVSAPKSTSSKNVHARSSVDVIAASGILSQPPDQPLPSPTVSTHASSQLQLQPPAGAHVMNGNSPRTLTQQAQQTIRGRLMSTMPLPKPMEAGAVTTVFGRSVVPGAKSEQVAVQPPPKSSGGVVSPTDVNCGQSSTFASLTDGPEGRSKSLAAAAFNGVAPTTSEPSSCIPHAAVDVCSSGDLAGAEDLVITSQGGYCVVSNGPNETNIGAQGREPRFRCGGGGSGRGLGLLSNGEGDTLSGDDDDDDAEISEDDELMEYFAAKSAGSGVGAGASGIKATTRCGDSRRTLTEVTTVAGAAAALARTGNTIGGVTINSGTMVGSSASLRRLPIGGAHAAVQGLHHGLYGTRQVSFGGNSSLTGTSSTNRRVAALVVRANELNSTGSSCDGLSPAVTGSPLRRPPLMQQAKRVTVGSYLSVQPLLNTAPEVTNELAQALPGAAVGTGPTTRPRTAGVASGATTDVGMYHNRAGGGAGMLAHTILHGALPALHTHHIPHHMLTTTTGTGLAPCSNIPHGLAYGRNSMPLGGYTSGQGAVVSGRQRAVSRQGSVAFNQLMYDALPEIGTPGGAPEVPTGTPPRRRIVMSGFTPCRTAAARAAEEGVPPAAAMAAVLGEVLHSTTDISVAFSPIQMGRSVDLLSPDQHSGPHYDAGNSICGIGSVGATALSGGNTAAAGLAFRRYHHRQLMGAAFHEPVSGTAGSAGAGTVGLELDGGLMFGSSAPTGYPLPTACYPAVRSQRHQENAPVAGSSGTAAGAVNISTSAATGGRIQLALAGGGGGSSVSGSSGTSLGPSFTPSSGARGFQPLPTARSRLACGLMMRESQIPSGPVLREFDADMQSGEMDSLTPWAGAVMSPGVSGMYMPAASLAAGAAAGSVACPVLGPPPPTRGRLGRWASGLIDSLPEDREVLHVQYGSFGVQNSIPGRGCDDAILGVEGSSEWALVSTGPLRNGGDVVGPPDGSTLPHGPSGPLPLSGAVRMTRSTNGGGDSRVTASAGASAQLAKPLPGLQPMLLSPPHSGSSPRLTSIRSRHNLPSSIASAATASPITATAIPPDLQLPPSITSTSSVAATFTAASGMRPADFVPRGGSAHVQLQGAAAAVELSKSIERPASSGSQSRRSSGSSKWPRAKAFLGGRFISSLVKKFKDQPADK